MNLINYLLLFVSLLFITLGSMIWKKQKVSLTFDFNNKNVKEVDVRNYTKSFGIAYLIIGLAVLLTTIARVTYHGRFEDVGFILFLIAFIISIIIILKTQVKYKTGLFH